jgi:hypothetical protein
VTWSRDRGHAAAVAWSPRSKHLPGLFIGIGVSLLLLLYRASRPHIALIRRVPGTRTSTGSSRAIRRTRSPTVW